MPTTANSGIDWSEYYEGYTENWAADQVTSTRVADVAWDDTDQFVLDCIGTHANVGGVLQRTLPEQQPFIPWLWCVRTNLQRTLGPPGADADGNPTFTTARYVLEYEALPYAILTDEQIHAAGGTAPELTAAGTGRYVQREDQYSVEALQLGGNTFQWNGGVNGPANPMGAQKILEPTAKPFYTKELTYTHWFLPSVNDAAISAAQDCVNATTFDVQGGPTNTGYPAGTVLYIGTAKTILPSTPSGIVLYKLAHKFSYRPGGWNSLWSPPDGAFEPVVQVANNAASIYSTYELANLFTLNQS